MEGRETLLRASFSAFGPKADIALSVAFARAAIASIGDLLKQFKQAGHGDVAKSWIGTGPNKRISPDDIEKTLGPEQVNTLAQQAGLSP